MAGASLRRRKDGSVELRVNGVFVMDNVETSSERALAQAVLGTGARRILIGGLGLGFTARELLAAADVTHLVVAEIEPNIVRWMRTGRIDGADVLADPRLDLRIADVRDVVAGLPPAQLDGIALDVDNGPDYLVYDDNATLYQSAFVGTCASVLRPAGSLNFWSQADSPPLRHALSEHFGQVTAERLPVTLQGRKESYWILRGQGPATPR